MKLKKEVPISLVDFLKEKIDQEEINVTALTKEAGVTESAVRGFLRRERPGITFLSVEKLLRVLGYQIVAQPVNKVRPGQAIELTSLEKR